MDKPVHRLGDLDDQDESVITLIRQQTVYVNNLLVSIDGSEINNGNDFTDNGSPTVFVENTPVNRKDDEDRISRRKRGNIDNLASPDVFIGDNPAPGA